MAKKNQANVTDGHINSKKDRKKKEKNKRLYSFFVSSDYSSRLCKIICKKNQFVKTSGNLTAKVVQKTVSRPHMYKKMLDTYQICVINEYASLN